MVQHPETASKKNALKGLIKVALRVFIFIIICVVAVGGWYAYRFSSLFTGSYVDFLRSNQPLERDQYDRSNLLLFGTSERTTGNHAPLLTDSIVVISINQNSKQGNTISIPRDLWVEYGQQCPSGTAGKINALYACSIRNGLSEKEAGETLAHKIDQIIGTDVHYTVKVNQTALVDVVTALDGIEVTIESTDPRGIYDVATGLRLTNGTASLDGKATLDLSRARGWDGGYGLDLSNFNREQHQQKIIRAIHQKTLSSLDELTEPRHAISIATSLSNDITTTIPARHMHTFLGVARRTNMNNIDHIDLVMRENPLVTTGEKNGQSIVLPAKGLFEYDLIHQTIQSAFEQPHQSVTYAPIWIGR